MILLVLYSIYPWDRSRRKRMLRSLVEWLWCLFWITLISDRWLYWLWGHHKVYLPDSPLYQYKGSWLCLHKFRLWSFSNRGPPSSDPAPSPSQRTWLIIPACVHNRSLMETRSQHQRTGSDIVPQRLHSPLQGWLHAIYFIFMLWNCHNIPFKSLALERANYRSLSLSLSLTLVLLFMFLRTFRACFMQFK